MKLKELVLLIGVLLLAFGVRVWKVAEVPASLYIDEIDLGYQAKSLLETGKDYRGGFSPFFVKSFNSDRTPIPVWLTMITTAVFKTPELQIRMTPVLLGTLGVGMSFYLVSLWLGTGAGIATAVVMALSPWMIQFSRIGFEATSVMAVLLFGLAAFFHWIKGKNEKCFWISVVLLSLSIYTYRTMSLFTPLLFLTLALIYKKEIGKLGVKKMLIALGIAGVIMGSFLYATTIASADETRIEQISIFSDPETAIWVQRNREISSGDYQSEGVGRKASLVSKIFYNKPLSWVDSLLNNYMEAFSDQFLFIKGDPNLRHSIPHWGMMIWLDLIGIGFGLWFLIKKRKQKWVQFLLAWLLVAPLASCLTTIGGSHAHRLFIMGIPLLMLTGIGWYRFWEEMKKLTWGKWLVMGVAVVWLGWWMRFYHSYLVHYPIESARWFGYGYKEAMETIKEVESEHGKIRLTESQDPPMTYFLWWNQVDPSELQSYGTNFSEETIKGMRLDKVKPINWGEEMKRKECKAWEECIEIDTLYLLSPDEIREDLRSEKPPKGIKLIKTILYPDKEAAFYLVARE